MWTFLDPSSGKDPREVVLKKLIDGFEAANLGVKISVEPQIWDQMTEKFLAASQTGTAPDIMWVHQKRVPAAVKLGALANLDELFARNKLWTKEDYDDVDGAYWQYGATDGAHYQVTHSRSIAGMYYRADMFKEAGIDPASITTWDQFIAAAQKLTVKDASGNVTRWGYGQSFTTTAVLPPVVFCVMLDRGEKVFDETGKASWATPAGIEGLTLETDMLRKYGITPDTALSLNGEDLYDQFVAGRMAIVRGASARVPRFIKSMGADKVGYLPTPSFTEGKSSPTEAAGWSVAVWSGSQYKDDAAKFVAYMSSKDADKMWTMEAGAVPIRQSTIKENPDFFNDPAHKYLAIVASSMVNAAWFPPEQDIAGWNEEFNRAAQAVIANGVDPKAALERAQDDFNRSNKL